MFLSRMLLARVDTREVDFVHDGGRSHGVDRVKRTRGFDLCNGSSEASVT
jgi:hypothetical protein